jgi:hypothetical protein
MKHLIWLCMFLGAAGLWAQPEDEEEVSPLKIAMITQRLALTSSESQVFWPVYNAMQEERKRFRREIRTKEEAIRQTMLSGSDAELTRQADELVALRMRENQLLDKYHTEFKKVLPIRKVVLLYRAEEDYRRELLRRLQERRAAGGAQPLRPRP